MEVSSFDSDFRAPHGLARGQSVRRDRKAKPQNKKAAAGKPAAAF